MLQPAKYQARKIEENKDIISFKGINRLPVINQGELRSMINLSSKYPNCIYPRDSRSVYLELGSGSALFATNNGKMCWVDGTNFLYDGVVKGTVTTGEKSIAELEGVVLIFPDKKYYNYKTNVFGTIGSGSPTDGEAPTTGQCPNMDYVCVFNNRIWGIKGAAVYGSKFNDPMTWAQYSVPVNEADSVYFKISSDSGSLTGLKALENHVIFTTNHALYEMYGTKPSNYIPRLVSNSRGCIDGRSMVEIDGGVFMLAHDGISFYGGSFLQLVSEQLQENYISGVACTDGRSYVICLYNGSAHRIYSLYKGSWYMEDNLQVKSFARLNNSIYALANDNKVYRFNSGTEVVIWEAETDRFTEQYLGKKATSKIKIEAELEANSTLSVYIKSGNADYVLVKTFTALGLKFFNCEIFPKRCDYFQIKIVGTGMAKVYELNRTIIIGSDIDNSGKFSEKNWFTHSIDTWDSVSSKKWNEL